MLFMTKNSILKGKFLKKTAPNGSNLHFLLQINKSFLLFTQTLQFGTV